MSYGMKDLERLKRDGGVNITPPYLTENLYDQTLYDGMGIDKATQEEVRMNLDDRADHSMMDGS